MSNYPDNMNWHAYDAATSGPAVPMRAYEFAALAHMAYAMGADGAGDDALALAHEALTDVGMNDDDGSLDAGKDELRRAYAGKPNAAASMLTAIAADLARKQKDANNG